MNGYMSPTPIARLTLFIATTKGSQALAMRLKLSGVVGIEVYAERQRARPVGGWPYLDAKVAGAAR